MKQSEKRDLKWLVPFVKEELAKGRTKKDILDELFLNSYQRQNINAYLRMEKPLDDEEETVQYLIERVREKKYVTVKGKRYLDVTADFIDCGG